MRASTLFLSAWSGHWVNHERDIDTKASRGPKRLKQPHLVCPPLKVLFAEIDVTVWQCVCESRHSFDWGVRQNLTKVPVFLVWIPGISGEHRIVHSVRRHKLMNHEHITLEIEHITLEVDYSTRARLQFQLPADATDDEIAYFKTLTPRVENGLLEMIDPDTWAVVFRCRPTLLN